MPFAGLLSEILMPGVLLLVGVALLTGHVIQLPQNTLPSGCLFCTQVFFVSLAYILGIVSRYFGRRFFRQRLRGIHKEQMQEPEIAFLIKTIVVPKLLAMGYPLQGNDEIDKKTTRMIFNVMRDYVYTFCGREALHDINAHWNGQRQAINSLPAVCILFLALELHCLTLHMWLGGLVLGAIGTCVILILWRTATERSKYLFEAVLRGFIVKTSSIGGSNG